MFNRLVYILISTLQCSIVETFQVQTFGVNLDLDFN